MCFLCVHNPVRSFPNTIFVWFFKTCGENITKKLFMINWGGKIQKWVKQAKIFQVNYEVWGYKLHVTSFYKTLWDEWPVALQVCYIAAQVLLITYRSTSSKTWFVQCSPRTVCLVCIPCCYTDNVGKWIRDFISSFIQLHCFILVRDMVVGL